MGGDLRREETGGNDVLLGMLDEGEEDAKEAIYLLEEKRQEATHWNTQTHVLAGTGILTNEQQ